MRKVKIYLIRFSDGRGYVGATSCELSLRMACHRWQAKNRPYATVGRAKELTLKNTTILLLTTEKRRDEFEKKAIRRISRFLPLINKTIGGRGPNGMKQSKRRLLQKSLAMKKRWPKSREKMLAAVNAHKTREFQSRVGKLGAIAMHAKYGRKAGAIRPSRMGN